jgi:hypothetical protein
MIALKTQSKIESLLGKIWMHNSTNYTITDFTEVEGKIIFSTDVKAITVKVDEVDQFIKDLLPVDELPAKQSPHVINIPGVDAGIFSELAGGLMSSFREIQGAKGTDEKFLKQAIQRSNAKVAISKTITDIAKTAIAGQKVMRSKN